MGKRLCIITMLFVAVAAAAACRSTGPFQLHEARPLMGTLVSITTEGPDERVLKDAVNAAYGEMSRLSGMMNHYDPASVVSAINRAAGNIAVAAPPELMEVLRMARAVSEKTEGAFDITVGSLTGWRFDPENPAMPAPRRIRRQLGGVNYRNVILDEASGAVLLKKRGMRVDLGGIAKLYILHAGMRVLREKGVRHALIDGGGDVVAAGTIHGRPWRVGIRDPRAPDSLFALVETTRGFVVSSGDYERYFIRDGKRYHHILDPRTGYPAQGPRHVTLLAEELELVNGLSAAIMVMGMDAGRRLIEKTPGLEGLIIGRDGRVWVSPGLEERLLYPKKAA